MGCPVSTEYFLLIEWRPPGGASPTPVSANLTAVTAESSSLARAQGNRRTRRDCRRRLRRGPGPTPRRAPRRTPPEVRRCSSWPGVLEKKEGVMLVLVFLLFYFILRGRPELHHKKRPQVRFGKKGPMRKDEGVASPGMAKVSLDSSAHSTDLVRTSLYLFPRPFSTNLRELPLSRFPPRMPTLLPGYKFFAWIRYRKRSDFFGSLFILNDVFIPLVRRHPRDNFFIPVYV